MIEYYLRTKRVDGQPDTIDWLSVLEHSELTTAVTIVDKDFVFKVQDSVDKIDDETPLYIPSIPLVERPLFPPR